jgi:hypothetical protein
VIHTTTQPVAVGAGDEVTVTVAGNFAGDLGGSEHRWLLVWVGVLRCGVGEVVFTDRPFHGNRLAVLRPDPGAG